MTSSFGTNLATTESIQTLIINTLGKDGSIPSTNSFSSSYNIDNNNLFGALKSLAAYDKVSYEPIETEEWVLTEEGKEICQLGSHEHRVLRFILESMPSGINPSELQVPVLIPFILDQIGC